MFNKIKTERLILRPLCEGDLYTTHEYAGDIDNTKYMIFLPNKTLGQTKTFLHNAALEWEKENPAFYELAVMLGNKHIGAVSVWIEEECIAELGWILHRDYCGRGYATEASLAIKAFAIEQLKAKKLVAHCDSRNKASQRVMQKLGMSLEVSDGIRTYPDERGSAVEYMYSLLVGTRL